MRLARHVRTLCISVEHVAATRRFPLLASGRELPSKSHWQLRLGSTNEDGHAASVSRLGGDDWAAKQGLKKSPEAIQIESSNSENSGPKRRSDSKMYSILPPLVGLWPESGAVRGFVCRVA